MELWIKGSPTQKQNKSEEVMAFRAVVLQVLLAFFQPPNKAKPPKHDPNKVLVHKDGCIYDNDGSN